MTTKKIVAQAVAVALAMPMAASAVEFSGYLKNETAVFTQSGQRTGEASAANDTRVDKDKGEVFKFENSARIFANGDVGEESSWHGELNLIYDSEAAEDYKSHRSYTQNDWLRELYFDTRLGEVDLRVGKQQVVWGTADGIKLLDIVNPTDYREFNQNTMEDSRIPVWMAVAEAPVGETGNIQLVIAQAEENKIAGLNDKQVEGSRAVTGNPFAGTTADNSQLQGVDSGHTFIMKGADSITGKVNGFLNIVPAMGAVSNTFHLGASNPPSSGGFGVASGLVGFRHVTVNDFVTDSTNPFAGFCASPSVNETAATPECLDTIAQMTNDNITNLINRDSWDTENPTSVFEFMPNATFATFNTFVGAKTRYEIKDRDEDAAANLGLRYKWSTEGGTNISLNYLYGYDANPSVSMHWENDAGEKLQTEYLADTFNSSGNTTVAVKDSAGNYYGACDPTDPTQCAATAGAATLAFVQEYHRIHNLGASFDTSIESDFLGPMVMRGEFLYQKDVYTPVVYRDKLDIGDLTGGLKAEKADFFKYVLGLDITVLTNMLVSTQFIQFINLDYRDEDNGRTYTGDQPVLHLTNGLKKADKYKNFGSLFFSKPFGESQEHRWNNITIYEKGGGWWNRLDMEYAFNDQFLATAEWNHYWGDENTMFGQFNKSSNVQLGLKYLFQ